MDITAFESAYEDLFSALSNHGYTKEAAELEARGFGFPSPSAQPAPTPATKGRFNEERPTAPEKPIFHGQSGSAAPVLELSRILDRVEQSPSFKYLPPNVVQGILKIKKMTGNAFKYASEKEALFGGERDPIKDLKSYLTKFDKSGPDPRKMPDKITKAVDNLNYLIDDALTARPQEKGILEKGMDVARGVAEKGKGLARGVAEKGQQLNQNFQQSRERAQEQKREDSINKFEEKQVSNERQQTALGALKKSLSSYKAYKDIFYRLPSKIVKALEGIGLGIEDLGNMATAKVACHINRTLLSYLRNKEAFSKSEMSLGKKEEKEHLDLYDTFVKVFKNKKLKVPVTKEQFVVSVAKAHLKEDPKYYSKLKKTFSKHALDFSGIGNLLTPEGKLDERELSRVIRFAIAAELDAVHLYELIVDSSDDETVKKVLQDISNEEKVHASELTELLNLFDKDNKKFVEDGIKEVKDLVGK